METEIMKRLNLLMTATALLVTAGFASNANAAQVGETCTYKNAEGEAATGTFGSWKDVEAKGLDKTAFKNEPAGVKRSMTLFCLPGGTTNVGKALAAAPTATSETPAKPAPVTDDAAEKKAIQTAACEEQAKKRLDLGIADAHIEWDSEYTCRATGSFAEGGLKL